ncbi:MAG: EAL domain-containing protein [Gammaproteobacteria bacterium]|nr:EAL domain-containing protein [Gammaproteobacteria bacterium]
MRLRSKFLLSFLLVALLPLLIVVTIIFREGEANLRQRVLADTRIIAEGKEAEILEYLAAKQSTAEHFASDGFIREHLALHVGHAGESIQYENSRELSAHLVEAKMPLDRDLIAIQLIDLSGRVIASTLRDEMGSTSEAEQPFFLRGRSRTYVQDLVIHQSDEHDAHRHSVMVIGTPVRARSAEGEIVGVLANHYALQGLSEVLSGLRSRQLGAQTVMQDVDSDVRVTLTNNDGIQIAPFLADEWLDRRDEEPVAGCITHQREVTGMWSGANGEMLWGASMCIPTNSDDHWTLMVTQDEQAVLAPIREMQRQVAGLAGILALLIALFALWRAGAITRPLAILEGGVKRIAEGDLEQQIAVVADDELGQLATTFNTMTRRLKQITASRDELNREIAERERIERQLLESQRNLKQLNEGLEKRIAERTAELLRFRTALDQSADLIYLIDPVTMRFIDYNRAVVDSLGFTEEELHNMGPDEICGQCRSEEGVCGFVSALEQNLYDHTLEVWHRRKDGSEFPVEITMYALGPQQDNLVLATARDISERKRVESKMRMLSGAMEQSADLVLMSDAEGRIEYVNRAFEQTTGYSRDEMVGENLGILRSGRMKDEFYRKMWQTLDGGEPFYGLFINRRKNGSLYYEDKTITPVTGSDGQILHFISTGKDITDLMEAEERLHHLATHDPLTGLPNRDLMLDRLQQSLVNAGRNQSFISLAVLDIDRFKNINDSLGHAAGDLVLEGVAQRLQASIRPGDTVARMSGGEFAILFDNLARGDDAWTVSEKLQEVFVEPFTFHLQELFISASMGIVLYPGDGDSAGQLLKNGESALYRAKEQGPGSSCFYTVDMNRRALERLSLENDLRRALEREEFVLYYQPLFDLKSGQITGAEALLRWQHPEHGMVSPIDFIDLLEATRLIVPVGEWVLKTACSQFQQWRESGLEIAYISVNLSPAQFADQRLLERIERIIDTYDMGSGALQLEITESTLMHHIDQASVILDQIHEMGAMIAIDDFGTGYSSFSYLTRLPIDALKIDRSFIVNIPGRDEDEEVVRVVIALAHALKMTVVAEGVESEQQQALLEQYQCDVLQGYFISRPIAAVEFERFVKSGGYS